MTIFPQLLTKAGRVSTCPDDRATQLTAQICAGIVTNRATEYLHPEAEARNMSAGVTKTIVRLRTALEKPPVPFSVPSRA